MNPEEKVENSDRPQKPKRSIFILRHGERMDFAFGDWIPYCFSKNGVFVQRDLNMPPTMPIRKGSPGSFFMDGPLTQLGTLQSVLIGEALRHAGITINHAYSSPSLRCVETCHYILKGLGAQTRISIKLEPGLFEWLNWYQNGMPQWMTSQELISAGFNVNHNYRPFLTPHEIMDQIERLEKYYMRSFFVTTSIIDSTAAAGGNILLVGHAATLDTCSRQLISSPPRNVDDLMRIIHRVPYCSMAVVQESDNHGWKLIDPPIPTFSNHMNPGFDWRILRT